MARLWVLVFGVVFLVGQCTFARSAPLSATAIEELTIACQGDAYRLCSWNSLLRAYAGSYGGVIACFKTNRASLTPSCRAIAGRYGLQ